MPKKSRQKLKYLENEKIFSDEIKSIFHLFEGLSLKQIKIFFLEGERPTFANFAKAWNFIRKRLQHRCFPLKFVKFLQTPALKNTCDVKGCYDFFMIKRILVLNGLTKQKKTLFRSSLSTLNMWENNRAK